MENCIHKQINILKYFISITLIFLSFIILFEPIGSYISPIIYDHFLFKYIDNNNFGDRMVTIASISVILVFIFISIISLLISSLFNFYFKEELRKLSIIFISLMIILLFLTFLFPVTKSYILDIVNLFPVIG